jgi:tRNA(Glu) U13 pseudouridine synthase TruD
MEYELNENTFFVKELFNPKLPNKGSYNYYLIEKKNVSHKQLARMLPTGYFCGKKDKNATTTQWFCSLDTIDELTDENVKVEFKGTSTERLHIGKHKGNQFRVKVNIDEEEFELLNSINFNKKKICNYFGDQRFDARVNKFRELIEMNSWEEALKFFLTEPSKFDSEKSTQIKKLITDNWGNWKEILKSEILPESKKELFGHLDLTSDFKKAFEYVEKRSLKTMLRSIQAQRFNLMLHNEALNKKPKGVLGTIDNEELLLSANKSFKRHIFVEPTDFEKSFGECGMGRKTFFQPKNFRIKKKDGYFVEFELTKGTYATVLLEFLKNYF